MIIMLRSHRSNPRLKNYQFSVDGGRTFHFGGLSKEEAIGHAVLHAIRYGMRGIEIVEVEIE